MPLTFDQQRECERQGPDNVRRWRAKMPNADVEFFVSDIGFTETKHYVQAVFAARAGCERNQ